MVLLVSSRVVPVGPARRNDNVVHVGVRVHDARIRSPCSSQIQQSGACNPTVQKGESCVFRDGLSTLRSHGSECRLRYGVEVAALGESFARPHQSDTMPVKFNTLPNFLSILSLDKLAVEFQWVKFGYLVERQAIAEDEVDGALDVAIFEVVATLMVVQSILTAHEAAAVECRGVACDSQRHCLLPYCSCWRKWRRVLPNIREIRLLSQGLVSDVVEFKCSLIS